MNLSKSIYLALRSATLAAPLVVFYPYSGIATETVLAHEELATAPATNSAAELESAEAYESITVSATRSSRDINEIAATVSVYTQEQIDALTATDIRDLVRFEPGVTVEGGGRFGLSGFNIRGINGDRVLILLDGAPIADEFSFGPALSARRDFVDIDTIKQVEIIRGPASTLYGSDAIGGVVSFISKDPVDFLQPGSTVGGKLKAGYASVANEYVVNGQLAAVAGDWQVLLTATQRDGDESETFFDDNLTGLARGAADPQQNDTLSSQLKVIYQPSEAHRWSLLLDQLDAESDTQVLSQVDTVIRGVRILDSQGIDERSRERYQLNYHYTGEQWAFDKFLARLYWQQTENRQDTVETRFGAASRNMPTPVELGRTRSSLFDQQVKGGISQFDKSFHLGAEHYLIYGMEVQYTDSEALREGRTFIAETNATVPEFSVFPARDFPISEARELSFFIQDEIQLLNDKLTISPGLRYDTFDLNPTTDEVFTNANPGVEVTSFEDSQLSAKLGAIYQLNNSTSVWLQFAEGFRIPPFDDLNVGFTNFAGGYTSLANPNLRPETVRSWELGARGSLHSFDWGVSVYHNDYEDFIESLATVGFNPITQLLEFQARNREQVTIEGIDAQLTWYLGESVPALHGWRVQTSLTWLQSEDQVTGQEVDSIIPPQAVVGVGYGAPDDPWSIELVATAVQRFDSQPQPADPNSAQLVEAPGYTTFDLLGHVQLGPEVVLNYGVFNLSNKAFFLSSDVRGRTEEENLNRFTQPGRNLAVNLTYHF